MAPSASSLEKSPARIEGEILQSLGLHLQAIGFGLNQLWRRDLRLERDI